MSKEFDEFMASIPQQNDLREESKFNFECKDPNCPHCAEDVAQMEIDDIREDDVEQTATEWLFEKLWETSKDKFTWYSILKTAKQMELKAKETLYTKEDVLKAGEIGEINHHDYKHIASLLDEAKIINQSLKQSKQ